MSENKRDSARASGPAIPPDEIGWDPDDAPELDDRWFAEADIRRDGKLIRRGYRPGETEHLVLPADLVAPFRARGTGWRTRIEAALKEWLEEHPERV